MKSTRSSLTPHRIASYCDPRLAPVLEPEAVSTVREYLADLLDRNEYPPYRDNGLDLKALVDQLGMDPTDLAQVRASLQPIFDAVARTVAEHRLRPQAKSRPKSSSAPGRAQTSRKVAKAPPASSSARKSKRPGRRPKPVVEFPDPLETTWEEPGSLGAALRLHAVRHGETIYHLCDAVMVAQHYGRFRPQDKAEIAARILNQVWDAA